MNQIIYSLKKLSEVNLIYMFVLIFFLATGNIGFIIGAADKNIGVIGLIFHVFNNTAETYGNIVASLITLFGIPSYIGYFIGWFFYDKAAYVFANGIAVMIGAIQIVYLPLFLIRFSITLAKYFDKKQHEHNKAI